MLVVTVSMVCGPAVRVHDSLCCLFKQKTAYEVRISDWSSDVCSSDLGGAMTKGRQHAGPLDSRSWLQAVRRPPAGPRLAATACTRVAADIYEGHGPQDRQPGQPRPAHPAAAACADRADRKSTRLNSSH